MHLGKFHGAIYSIQIDFESLGVLDELQRLESTLQQSINQPNESTSQAFKDQYARIIQILESCETNSASPTQRKIFDAIGATENMGATLLSQITKILSDNNLAPAEALNQITELHQRVRPFYNTIKEIVEVLVGEPQEPEEETTDEGTKVNQKKVKAYEERKKLADAINAKGRSLIQIGKAQKSILKLEISGQKTGD